MTIDELRNVISDLGESRFRAVQLSEWLYKRGLQFFPDMNNMPKSFIEKLDKKYTIQRGEKVVQFTSGDKKTSKFLIKFHDNVAVETVLMRQSYGNSICISSQWAQVQNQYQRRMDLIPNLVSTVKGYAKHESDVFTQIADARSKAGGVVNVDSSILDDPEAFAKYQKVQGELGSSLQYVVKHFLLLSRIASALVSSLLAASLNLKNLFFIDVIYGRYFRNGRLAARF